MNWKHRCNFNWLIARQKYLTATDIVSLIPYTKTGRERKVTDEDYLRVLSSKLKRLIPSDTVSTGAAARGHILEPYAVDKVNEASKLSFKHWDDMIIYSQSNHMYPMAFSPDAATMDMPEDLNLLRACEMPSTDFDANRILEIKSYTVEKHLSHVLIPKDKVDERWQLAVAMAVCPTIEIAHLAFFQPSIFDHQVIMYTYTREDLKEEIETAFKIAEDFDDFCHRFEDINNFDTFDIYGESDYELQIIEEYEAKKELNPW